ncbi:MAG: undecaprenyl-diphosphate phosphatase [Rhodobacteraceae bacterium]|nr:undecaprenyl-diphosphate phosphatase [Paracoccaceae bacterium]
MSFLHLFLLAMIQGITEFLPVSSSGHLILLPKLMGVEDQGPILDVAVHVGTLAAVMLYFWRDVAKLILGLAHVLCGRFKSDAAKLFLLLVVATIPVVVAGLALKLFGNIEALRNIKVIGWTMLGFGIVLYIADRKGGETRTDTDWTLRDAIVMGFWQVLALIPGTSRSGATITAARILGFSRKDGAKLAMLMSIPTIMASGVLLGRDVVIAGDWQLASEAGIAALMSFFAAMVALSLMMRLLNSVSFTPYVIYRVVLGLVLLGFAYLG